jgi:micrococcal nuclease
MKVRRAAVTAAVLVLLAGCGAPDRIADPDGSTAAAQRTAPTGPVSQLTGPVAKVTDGDTVHVTAPDGTDVTVRLIGINTPETTKGKHECMGAEATARVTELVTGQPVTVTADPTQADTDRYGRSIRYIDLPDGTDVQLTLISDGLAREVQYGRKYQRQGRYVDAERAARTEQRGGWAPADRGGCGWT